MSVSCILPWVPLLLFAVSPACTHGHGDDEVAGLADAADRVKEAPEAAEITPMEDDPVDAQPHVVQSRTGTVAGFDLHWLDKCPLLDLVRERPEYAALRERIAERCHRIYDALWS